MGILYKTRSVQGVALKRYACTCIGGGYRSSIVIDERHRSLYLHGFLCLVCHWNREIDVSVAPFYPTCGMNSPHWEAHFVASDEIDTPEYTASAIPSCVVARVVGLYRQHILTAVLFQVGGEVVMEWRVGIWMKTKVVSVYPHVAEHGDTVEYHLHMFVGTQIL